MIHDSDRLHQAVLQQLYDHLAVRYDEQVQLYSCSVALKDELRSLELWLDGCMLRVTNWGVIARGIHHRATVPSVDLRQPGAVELFLGQVCSFWGD